MGGDETRLTSGRALVCERKPYDLEVMVEEKRKKKDEV